MILFFKCNDFFKCTQQQKVFAINLKIPHNNITLNITYNLNIHKKNIDFKDLLSPKLNYEFQ